MPFKKSIATEYGTPAEFWAVNAFHSLISDKAIDVALAGYINEKAFTDGATPIVLTTVSLANKNFGFPSLADLEIEIAKTEAWKDAEKTKSAPSTSK